MRRTVLLTVCLLGLMTVAAGPETAAGRLSQSCADYLEFDGGELYKIDAGGYHRLLDKESYYKKVDAQAQEVALFISSLHRMNPVKDRTQLPFRVVRIVPKGFWPSPAMELVGDTLIVRLGWRLIPSDRLLTMWHAGKQYPRRSFERRMWKYINPNGTTMQLVRKGMAAGAKVIAGRLRQTADSKEGPIAERVIEHLQFVLGDPAPSLIDGIRARGDQELRDWVRNLATAVESDSLAASLVASARVEAASADDKTLEVNIVDSWVGYGNYHWITVLAGYGDATSRLVLTNGATSPTVRAGTVNIINSIVGGYTVDVVDVRAFSDRLVLAAALAQST